MLLDSAHTGHLRACHLSMRRRRHRPAQDSEVYATTSMPSRASVARDGARSNRPVAGVVSWQRDADAWSAVPRKSRRRMDVAYLRLDLLSASGDSWSRCSHVDGPRAGPRAGARAGSGPRARAGGRSWVQAARRQGVKASRRRERVCVRSSPGSRRVEQRRAESSFARASRRRQSVVAIKARRCWASTAEVTCPPCARDPGPPTCRPPPCRFGRARVGLGAGRRRDGGSAASDRAAPGEPERPRAKRCATTTTSPTSPTSPLHAATAAADRRVDVPSRAARRLYPCISMFGARGMGGEEQQPWGLGVGRSARIEGEAKVSGGLC